MYAYDTDGTTQEMNYTQQRKDNTDRFNNLSKDDQKKARKMGYHNNGRENVTNSAKILDTFYTFTVDSTTEEIEEIDEKDQLIAELRARIEELEEQLEEVQGELEEAEEEIINYQEEQFFQDVPTIEEMGKEEKERVLKLGKTMEGILSTYIHQRGNGYGMYTSQLISLTTAPRADVALMVRGAIAHGRFYVSGNVIVDGHV